MKGQLKALALAALLMGTVHAQAATADKLSNFADYGFASKSEMKEYFNVQKVEVKEWDFALTEEQLQRLQEQLPPVKPSKPGQPTKPVTPTTPQPPSVKPTDIISEITGVDIQTWITLGEKLWQVIANNKPVANVGTQRVSVLPMAQQDWVQMENWQGPSVKTYTIEAKNGFGMTVISHTYTVAYNYGGQYQGKGAFLANATIIPTSVDVTWGFTLNSEVEVGQTVNTATKDAPVPGIDLQLKWKMDSLVKHSEGVNSFFIKGDGTSTLINGPM